MHTMITSIFKEGCVRTYLECSHLLLLRAFTKLLLCDLLSIQELFILVSLARQTEIEVPKTPVCTPDQYVSRTASKGFSELNKFSVKLLRTN